jgi:hypothetical protein
MRENIMTESDKLLDYEIMPLFKYHACPDYLEKQEWVKQILVEHQLFFASRKSFNDPFDCVIPNFLQLPGTNLKRFAEEFVDRNFSDAAEVEKIGMKSKLMSVKALEDIRKMLQDEIDKAGIVCFSRVRDDMLMWAHYADKHRGLCFEFDGSANCRFFGEAQPVEYEDYTPIPLDKDKERQMTRVILTKSKHWVYEREYRIFQPEKSNSKLAYPGALLTGIIFGCMMPDNIRKLVKQWAEEGSCRVAFFEARPKMAEFGLDIVRID